MNKLSVRTGGHIVLMFNTSVRDSKNGNKCFMNSIKGISKNIIFF